MLRLKSRLDRDIEEANDPDDQIAEREDCDRCLGAITSADDPYKAQQHQRCL